MTRAGLAGTRRRGGTGRCAASAGRGGGEVS